MNGWLSWKPKMALRRLPIQKNTRNEVADERVDDNLKKSRKERFNKTLDFMDTMVRAVFIGTFIFTAAVMYFVWNFGWEATLLSLIDKWFTIMVSELIIMGVIQIAKRGVEVVETREETKKEILKGEDDLDGD